MKISKQLESAEDGVRGPGATDRQRAGLVLIGVGLATCVAYRAVLIAPFGFFEATEFESWFFIPGRDSGALSVLIASWLLWNRRGRFASTGGSRIGAANWAAATAVLLVFLWAAGPGAPALMIPVLCAQIATLATAWGGRAGLRLVAMPCFALLLAFPPPNPLQAEIIWRLQNLTAGGASWLLSMAGLPVELEGTELRLGGHAFVLIEACSGWRGIQILSLVGLLAAELRAIRFPRALWVVLAAAPLGLALNVLRVCLVVLTQEEIDAEFFESHTPQGIAVLLIGSVILYCIAIGAKRSEGRTIVAPAAAANDEGASYHAPAPAPARQFERWLELSLALPTTLALVSLLIPQLLQPAVRPDRRVLDFPTALLRWSGTPLGIDYFFPYSTNSNPQFHVEFQNPSTPGGGELVDLFIAREMPESLGLNRMPDSKLLLPANDWNISSRESARIWRLGIDGERAIVSRQAGSKFTYIVAWRLHDDGLIRESLKFYQLVEQ